jgi:hypothetical protein
VDARDIDSAMMGKSRAITAIEPLKGDTVFVADAKSWVDGKRPRSGLILFIYASRQFVLVKSERLAGSRVAICSAP